MFSLPWQTVLALHWWKVILEEQGTQRLTTRCIIKQVLCLIGVIARLSTRRQRFSSVLGRLFAHFDLSSAFESFVSFAVLTSGGVRVGARSLISP